MARWYKRKKSNFSSARAAWRDIDRRTGFDPQQVIESDHTRTHYRWKLPDR